MTWNIVISSFPIIIFEFIRRQMATAGGYGGYRTYGSSSSINRNSSPDDYSSPRSSNQYSVIIIQNICIGL